MQTQSTRSTQPASNPADTDLNNPVGAMLARLSLESHDGRLRHQARDLWKAVVEQATQPARPEALAG